MRLRSIAAVSSTVRCRNIAIYWQVQSDEHSAGLQGGMEGAFLYVGIGSLVHRQGKSCPESALISSRDSVPVLGGSTYKRGISNVQVLALQKRKEKNSAHAQVEEIFEM